MAHDKVLLVTETHTRHSQFTEPRGRAKTSTFPGVKAEKEYDFSRNETALVSWDPKTRITPTAPLEFVAETNATMWVTNDGMQLSMRYVLPANWTDPTATYELTSTFELPAWTKSWLLWDDSDAQLVAADRTYRFNFLGWAADAVAHRLNLSPYSVYIIAWFTNLGFVSRHSTFEFNWSIDVKLKNAVAPRLEFKVNAYATMAYTLDTRRSQVRLHRDKSGLNSDDCEENWELV